jgi:ferredoxin-NADP reductase
MQQLKLLSSRNEAGNIKSFVFETGGLTWVAGQNQAFVLPQAGPDEADNLRWFTLASAPSEKVVQVSTRVGPSAFKQALDRLQPGDSIGVRDLGGDFTWEEDSTTPVVLVAGGIGVTPFRSILLERHARGQLLNATLLYFSRDAQIAFRDELDQLCAQHPELDVRYLIGGLITAERILDEEPQATRVPVYLSGPEPMVESVGNDLKQRGVDLKQDWFPGYDERNY